MKSTETTYTRPEIVIISMETEQGFLAGSGVGGNQGLYEDLNDYSDYFE